MEIWQKRNFQSSAVERRNHTKSTPNSAIKTVLTLAPGLIPALFTSPLAGSCSPPFPLLSVVFALVPSGFLQKENK
jgi:hypothetical protein